MRYSYKIFVFLVFLLAGIDADAKNYKASYSVRPTDLTEPAPLEFNHIIRKKQDTTGSIYTCIATDYWKSFKPSDVGLPDVPGVKDFTVVFPVPYLNQKSETSAGTITTPVICNYAIDQNKSPDLLNHPDLTPSDLYLDKFRGPDVLNPCAGLRSKYTNNYYDYGVGSNRGKDNYDDDPNTGLNFNNFCDKMNNPLFSDNQIQQHPEKFNENETLLAAMIFPGAYAQTYSNLNLSYYKNCYDVFDRFSKSGNNQLSKKDAGQIDVCIAACESGVPTVKEQQFCGVDKCQMEARIAGRKPSEWCCSLASYYQTKTQLDINPLANVYSMCQNTGDGFDLQTCLREFSSKGKMPQSCCQYSRLISNYSSKAGADVNRYCSSYNTVKACLANYDKTGKIDESCCAMNYAYSGVNDFAPLFKNYNIVLRSRLVEGIKKECTGYNLANDNMITSCKASLSKDKKLNQDCCIAYHTGKLIPSLIGISYDMIDKYCYPEKYKK